MFRDHEVHSCRTQIMQNIKAKGLTKRVTVNRLVYRYYHTFSYKIRIPTYIMFIYLK